MCGGGHGTIVKVSTDAIEVMVVIDTGCGRGILGRRCLKNVRKRWDGRSDGRIDGLVEKSIEFARCKRGKNWGCRGVKIRGDKARMAWKVEEFIIMDIKRLVVGT
jgi:hypothetical protein